MNAAVILGILGAVLTLIGLIPLLGIINWISIILLLTGLTCGIIGINTEPEEKRGSSITGTIICTLFSIIAVIRLILGGGVL